MKTEMQGNGDAVQHDVKSGHPTVSVIVPAYDVALFIKETLDSILAQTFRDYEVIVVNDGAPDTSELELVLQPYLSQIIYVKQENRGCGGARNTGLRKARGEYVAFLDGDDVWLPDFLSEQMKFIESDGGYDLVYCNAYHFGDHCVGMTYMETCPSNGPVTFESLLTAECSVIASGVVARKQIIFDAGLFDEKLPTAEDFDLWIRLAKLPKVRISYQRSVLLGYRHRSGSLSNDITRHLERSLKAFEKIRNRTDLTAQERQLVDDALASRKSVLATRMGKDRLLSGEIERAKDLFATAQRAFPNWKLRVTLAAMHVAPRLVQWVYRKWGLKEASGLNQIAH